MPEVQVVRVHLVQDDAPGLTACTGEPWTPPGPNEYPGAARELCQACARAAFGPAVSIREAARQAGCG